MAYSDVVPDTNSAGEGRCALYVGDNYGTVLNVGVFSHSHLISVTSEDSIVPNLQQNQCKMLTSIAGKVYEAKRDQSTFVTDDLLLIETSPITAALGATKTSLSMDVF